MPIYEYVCSGCGEVEEYILPMEHNPPACDKCDEPTNRVVSAASFHLKGSGWAKDGYAGKFAGGSGYKEGEALKKATAEAKQDLKNTQDSLEKKSRA